MGVTSKELAEICGVSRGTVDRALNGKGRISPKTKEKILSVAKEMGYRKDLLARGLVKGKTMCIGVVVFDLRNSYFAQMVNAIGLQASELGYSVNITLHEKDRQKEIQLIDSLVSRRTDGIIICPVNKGENFSRFLHVLPIPVVSIGNFVSPTLPYVGIDEKAAAGDAVSLLLAKGYRRIVFVCPPLCDEKRENVYTHEQRAKGVAERVAMASDAECVVIGDWDYLSALDSLPFEGAPRTAVLCSGDIYALQAMMHLKQRGLHIPQDVGIMGFDNIDMLGFVTPRLATVSNEIDTVARSAVDLLIGLMNGEEGKAHILVPHTVIQGDSI